MGEKQETFLTTLPEPHATWVKSLALLFGSRAAALAMCVKIVKAAMDGGILPRDLYELKSLVANTPKGMDSGGAALLPEPSGLASPGGQNAPAKPPRRLSSASPQRGLRRSSLESEAVAYGLTPFPAAPRLAWSVVR